MSNEAVEIGRLYAPIQQIADVLSASQKDIFIDLPGLQGYWPGGVRSGVGELVEHSGEGSYLSSVGVVPTGFDGSAYAHVGNGTNYFSRAAVGQLQGNETWIDASIRGITIGCWFSLDILPSVGSGVMSRDGSTSQRGYALQVQSSGAAFFQMSGTGAALLSAGGTTLNLTQWTFLVGRFTPSTEVACFVNGEKNINTTAIPSACFVSSQAFEIGRYFNQNSRIVSGKFRDAFICAAALSDATIAQLRDSSAP